MSTDVEPFVLRSNSYTETIELGRSLGVIVEPGDWIGLTGDLGAGKTCFSGGLARGLGVGEEVSVTSPTFTIIQTYHGRLRLNHLDLYRLGDYSELLEIGYEELLEQDCVILVEWCDKFPKALGTDGIIISFSLIDEQSRQLTFRQLGPRGAQLLKAIQRLV